MLLLGLTPFFVKVDNCIFLVLTHMQWTVNHKAVEKLRQTQHQNDRPT